MTDCIIVGGGLMGMLSARELTKAGLDVLVLDRGRLGQESSWAGGGILSPLHPWRYAEQVNEIANVGHRLYEQLAEELLQQSGIDPEYNRCGLLVLNSTQQQLATEWAERWSMPLELLEDKAALQAVLPGLADGYDQGLWMPDIAQMRNPRLVKSLRGSLDAMAIKYLENTPVERLEVHNQQIKGVVANGKTYHSERVLIAGGAWSASILQAYGDVPEIEPVKGQMIIFRGKPDDLKRMVLCENRYLIPRRDGRILCGSTIEYTGFDKSTSESVAEELRNSAISLFPALANMTLEHHWAGLRPGSPDGIPYIGEHKDISGLYINSGHFRNGVILGLGSARRIASLITSN